MALISESASAVIGFIAFTSLLRGLPKVCPQTTALRLITPNILIVGLMTDASFYQFKAANGANDLLR